MEQFQQGKHSQCYETNYKNFTADITRFITTVTDVQVYVQTSFCILQVTRFLFFVFCFTLFAFFFFRTVRLIDTDKLLLRKALEYAWHIYISLDVMNMYE